MKKAAADKNPSTRTVGPRSKVVKDLSSGKLKAKDFKRKKSATKMKKESMAKQTKKQKEKLPAGLVKEIAKKAGKAGTAVAREGIKAAGSKKKSKKSPMEQGKTKFTDKVKAFGKAITSKYGLMTPENAAIKKAYSMYKKEKKKYRQAAASK